MSNTINNGIVIQDMGVNAEGIGTLRIHVVNEDWTVSPMLGTVTIDGCYVTIRFDRELEMAELMDELPKAIEMLAGYVDDHHHAELSAKMAKENAQ